MNSAESEGSQHIPSPDVKQKKKRKSGHDSDKPKTVKKPKPKTVKKPTVSRTDTSSKKVYKSAEYIDTSDDDDDVGDVSLPALASKGKEAVSAKEPPKKRRKKAATKSSNAEAEGSPATKPRSKQSASEPGPSNVQPSVDMDVGMNEKSESEMSVLINATPIKKKAKKREKTSTKTKKVAAEKKSKKAGPALSKDEEAIKRLKSYVNACGVRKVWSKEFQDLDRPSQQVQRLRTILAELGMDGRPSMEKAKEIKEKRALAQELADVRSFEQAVVGQPSRLRSKGHSNDRKSDDGDEGAFSDEVPVKKDKNAARKSIMAFLGDDSDDE